MLYLINSLILFSGDSGKTTFLKQMKLLYSDVDFTPDEIERFALAVRDNLIKVVQVLKFSDVSYILDAWQTHLGPTQGQYSVVVEMFGAFGRPPSDVQLIRLRSKVAI